MRNMHLAAMAAFALINAADAATVKINEFNPNPPGADGAQGFIELIGDPGASLDGFSLVLIEGDVSSSEGQVDEILPLDGLTIGSNGLLLIAEDPALATGIAPGTAFTTTPDLDDPENPSNTLVLASGVTAIAFDPDDATVVPTDVFDEETGNSDFSSLGTVFDAIGVEDNDAATDDGAVLFGAALGGVDLAVFDGQGALPGDEPPLVFLEPTTGVLFQGDVDFAPIANAAGVLFDSADFTLIGATPGAPNPSLVVPEPATALLVSLSMFALAGVRRQR